MQTHYALIAARQQGLVARAQLLETGMSEDAVERRLREGLLTALHPGVYATAGAPDSFERRVMAAVLAAGGLAAASHCAAATLLGIGELPRSVEISVPRSQRPRIEGVRIFRPSFLPPDHLIESGGIRVTCVSRTLCDLAAVLGERDLELTLDHALSRRRVTMLAVLATLLSLPSNSKGSGAMRRLLSARGDGRARAESPLELELHRILERARIPGWDPQHEVAGCRIDAAFPEARLAVQMDSYRHHSSRSDWVRDHRRHSNLVTAGWRVLPVTNEDLLRENELVTRIRAALVTFTRGGRG